MNGTAAIVAAMATELIIIASLNRHGKRFVQCFVFSKIDMSVPPIVSVCRGIIIKLADHSSRYSGKHPMAELLALYNGFRG
jgi:hypothetical protein